MTIIYLILLVLLIYLGDGFNNPVVAIAVVLGAITWALTLDWKLPVLFLDTLLKGALSVL